ncbi:MAG: hypothetical protein EOO47_21705 [Flavobacterium sp.]|nr:MAG: hypothetical protein EOO47_21705 [Flavobacterium sp.]
MNDTQFLTYQKFSDKALADELMATLATNNIEFLFEDATPHFDHTFANNQTNNEYLVKLKSSDFEKVDNILTTLSSKDLNAVDQDHYLFDFTEEELRDILLKSDEWSKYDYLLAQKILRDRGHKIDTETINVLKEKRFEELAKPDKNQKRSILAGYVFAIFGGLIAIFIGWHLFSHKKTLPNGGQVYSYSEQDRKQGIIILILGTVSAIIWTAFRLIKD